MSPRKRGRVTIVGALALAALVAAVSLGVAGAGAGEQSAFALPRAQTFYMSGNQWAPYGDVNPAKTWDYSTGTIGLAYETAFRFNPLKGTFIPWLATSGTWRTSNVYVMNIRRGVKFSDGTTLTPGDVKYSFDLLKIPTHPQNALWASTGLKSVKVVGNTVVFTFAGKPGYQQFDFYRYNVAIVPRHVFSKYTVTRTDDGQSRREPDHRYRPVHVSCPVRAPRLRPSSGSGGATGGQPRRSASGRRRGTSSTSTTRRTRRRSPTSRPGTSTSSTTSPRDRRSRASSRPSTARRRITWVRTRRGSSRTRRRSRSTIRSSAALSRSRST